MRKTYIFFEPNDKVFFEKVTNIYGELLKKYYEDAQKSFTKDDNHDFYNNYVNNLIFPACDYNDKLQCPRTVCCPDKRLALTEDQKDWVIESLKDVIKNLRTVRYINNIIVDRILQNSIILLNAKTEPLSYKNGNSLLHYLQLMMGVSRKTDADNLVYICPINNKYNYFREEMLKSNLKALVECVYYR
jgi:hypothetical protein